MRIYRFVSQRSQMDGLLARQRAHLLVAQSVPSSVICLPVLSDRRTACSPAYAFACLPVCASISLPVDFAKCSARVKRHRLLVSNVIVVGLTCVVLTSLLQNMFGVYDCKFVCSFKLLSVLGRDTNGKNTNRNRCGISLETNQLGNKTSSTAEKFAETQGLEPPQLRGRGQHVAPVHGLMHLRQNIAKATHRAFRKPFPLSL